MESTLLQVELEQRRVAASPDQVRSTLRLLEGGDDAHRWGDADARRDEDQVVELHRRRVR